ncbi:MAG: DegV family EDD domain-containing protein [Cephaloticoccus sp.]|nr:DegV family EDD domain-containing protein [Cephaloticoccus sp.]MCF7761190.1 DegV family EDD domain-containing protein [Cephaloticoccus sp.]
MKRQRLSGQGLRRALIAGIQNVIAQRDEINRINVYPMPDHDAGTNLAFTLGAVWQGLQEPGLEGVGAVLQRTASEASDSARGNSGAIMAQFFHGLAEALATCHQLTTQNLAEAVMAGSLHARMAMAEPCEGTILSVMQAFADEWEKQVKAGVHDFGPGFAQACTRSRVVLQQTRKQLPALRSAGVVDAGGLGFVSLLEGINAYINQGSGMHGAEIPAGLVIAGVDTSRDLVDSGTHRYSVECLISADTVDRTGLKAALLELPLSRQVITGPREQVHLHAHVDEPAAFLAVAARFGTVSRKCIEDLSGTVRPEGEPRTPVVIVTDSGSDIPAELMARLNIHLVPQRLTVNGQDHVDRVSISSHELYHAMRTSSIPARTSQPPTGDFRRMFEYLLTHHQCVVDVSLARSLSGTLQSAERAAARTDPQRVHVFDTRSASAGQGLLTIWAAEAAHAGLDAPQLLAGLERMQSRTKVYALVQDIQYAVRGGRAPRVALWLTRLLRFSLTLTTRPNGRLGVMSALWGRRNLPEHFAGVVLRRLEPTRRYRVLVGHCDCPEQARQAHAALLASSCNLDASWVVEIGVAIGAHAGPGSLVIATQDYEPPNP